MRRLGCVVSNGRLLNDVEVVVRTDMMCCRLFLCQESPCSATRCRRYLRIGKPRINYDMLTMVVVAASTSGPRLLQLLLPSSVAPYCSRLPQACSCLDATSGFGSLHQDLSDAVLSVYVGKSLLRTSRRCQSSSTIRPFQEYRLQGRPSRHRVDETCPPSRGF